MLLSLSEAIWDLMVGRNSTRSFNGLHVSSTTFGERVFNGRLVYRWVWDVLHCFPICLCTLVFRIFFNGFSWVAIKNWPRGLDSSFCCMDDGLSMIRNKF